ncbi:hypothetical protein [Nocardioides soli]|uniref:Pyruvate/oxaloacetate carboxyltransferase n=1 Tax=Nocardioides soli TaxID=1036020 RepID=A0A7W4Z5B6_9ACTN|nr:pyruvate/oxaloacetate carboxyltransferase [Nocardioides soli]
MPTLQARLDRLRVDEIHSHTTTGISPLTVLAAADVGVDTIHCALPPLANGGSHPPGPRLVKNLHARGYRTHVDVEAMADASAYLMRQARIKGLPIGTPNEYDEEYYRHTIPGGVQSTTRRQLAEIGKADLFDAVIEEVVQVREDLGWPIVMTPFAQYIVTQATLNVIGGERVPAALRRGSSTCSAATSVRCPGRSTQDLMDRAMATSPRHARRRTRTSRSRTCAGGSATPSATRSCCSVR